MLFLLLPATYAYNVEILETTPSPIIAGNYADITVRVSLDNGAEDRRNVLVGIRETDSVRPLAGESLEFDNFEEGDRITRTMRVFFSSDISQGNIPLSFDIEDDSGAISIRKEVFVKGSEDEPDFYIGSIESLPKELLPDTDNNKIILSLQNLGEKKAELITAELAETDILKEAYTYSMRDSISSLSGGEEKEIEFNFDIESNTAVTIETILTVRYRTQNEITGGYETFVTELPVKVRTSRAPNFEIISVESDPLKTGSLENRVLVKLQNIGLVEGESVRLRIYPDPEIPIDFTRTSFYVSSIVYPNETASIPIEIDIQDTATIRNYPINAEIESMVGSTRYIETERIPLEVVGHSVDKGTTLRNIFLGGAFVVAVILGIGVLSSRKKKK